MRQSESAEPPARDTPPDAIRAALLAQIAREPAPTRQIWQLRARRYVGAGYLISFLIFLATGGVFVGARPTAYVLAVGCGWGLFALMTSVIARRSARTMPAAPPAGGTSVSVGGHHRHTRRRSPRVARRGKCTRRPQRPSLHGCRCTLHLTDARRAHRGGRTLNLPRAHKQCRVAQRHGVAHGRARHFAALRLCGIHAPYTWPFGATHCRHCDKLRWRHRHAPAYHARVSCVRA
jgi:hypothetical protein